MFMFAMMQYGIKQTFDRNMYYLYKSGLCNNNHNTLIFNQDVCVYHMDINSMDIVWYI